MCVRALIRPVRAYRNVTEHLLSKRHELISFIKKQKGKGGGRIWWKRVREGGKGCVEVGRWLWGGHEG